MLTFNEYQEKTKETAVYHESIADLLIPALRLYKPTANEQLTNEVILKVEKILNLSYVGLGLGEVGEIQGKIKKIIRDSGGVITPEVKKAIGKELGDLLWYVSETCNELNLDMGEVAGGNLEKLADRKDRGVLYGSGDNR